MDLILDILKYFRISMFMKYPCNRCLVKPICKVVCENRETYIRVFGYSKESQRNVRIATWFLAFYIVFLVPWLILM